MLELRDSPSGRATGEEPDADAGRVLTESQGINSVCHAPAGTENLGPEVSRRIWGCPGKSTQREKRAHYLLLCGHHIVTVQNL